VLLRRVTLGAGMAGVLLYLGNQRGGAFVSVRGGAHCLFDVGEMALCDPS
jgi:hypothetical protein